MQNETVLDWVFNSLGLYYSLVFLFTTVLSFVLTLVLVIRGRGPFCVAALVLIVPMPFLVGLFGVLNGTIRSLTIIAVSAAEPSPAELAAGNATALTAFLVGLILTTPGYLVACGGMFARALLAKPDHAAKV